MVRLIILYYGAAMPQPEPCTEQDAHRIMASDGYRHLSYMLEPV